MTRHLSSTSYPPSLIVNEELGHAGRLQIDRLVCTVDVPTAMRVVMYPLQELISHGEIAAAASALHTILQHPCMLCKSALIDTKPSRQPT
jgi:hypothetical protein